ncbi:hypothetical protein [Oceanicola sp. S124]|uniref:hypothetical protein n=1 Tax=Oceanicola sp. S124 TaxID=1042378 RepID=UPI0002558932
MPSAAEMVTHEREQRATPNIEANHSETHVILWRDKTMINFIKNFRKNESGAVTVDWVVLTAAIVALGGAAYTAISGGAADLTADTAKMMSDATVTDGNTSN